MNNVVTSLTDCAVTKQTVYAYDRQLPIYSQHRRGEGTGHPKEVNFACLVNIYEMS